MKLKDSRKPVLLWLKRYTARSCSWSWVANSCSWSVQAVKRFSLPCRFKPLSIRAPPPAKPPVLTTVADPIFPSAAAVMAAAAQQEQAQQQQQVQQLLQQQVQQQLAPSARSGKRTLFQKSMSIYRINRNSRCQLKFRSHKHLLRLPTAYER